jgi:hypothetical protein
VKKHLVPYRIYVIRCWGEQSSQANSSIYRFTLDVPATGERFGFTSSGELINALELALFQIQTQELTEATSEDEPY